MNKREFKQWAGEHGWVFVTEYIIAEDWVAWDYITPVGNVIHVEFQGEKIHFVGNK